tara:strand:- start:525 stop:998 length:474 start_codon:yes stop_codon:yes gene_type:complete
MKEHVTFAKEMQIPKTLLIENGDVVKLLPGSEPKKFDKAPTGKLYLDGYSSVDADAQSIRDRKNIANNGYLEITLIITNNGKIKKPVISFKGIPNNNGSDNFVFDIEDVILDICRTFSIQNKNQEKNLIETIKQNCRKILKDKTGKKPFTNINIARI